RTVDVVTGDIGVEVVIPCEAHRRSVCRIRELKYKCVCKHEQYTAAHAKELIQPRKPLLHCVLPCGVCPRSGTRIPNDFFDNVKPRDLAGDADGDSASCLSRRVFPGAGRSRPDSAIEGP